jgi:hypothetical protein
LKIKLNPAREEAMKFNPGRPSSAMVVALLALFFAVGGNVVAYGLGRNSVHSRDIAPGAVRANDLGKFQLRTSSVLDLDKTAGDGIFAAAGGRAKCKPGEQLITGGSREQHGGETVIPHIQLMEEGPVPVERAWAVKWSSDLGGAASEDFVVYALCLVR